MARTPAEVAANNLKAAKSRVRTIGRREAKAAEVHAALTAQLERAKALLEIARVHPDLDDSDGESDGAAYQRGPAVGDNDQEPAETHVEGDGDEAIHTGDDADMVDSRGAGDEGWTSKVDPEAAAANRAADAAELGLSAADQAAAEALASGSTSDHADEALGVHGPGDPLYDDGNSAPADES